MDYLKPDGQQNGSGFSNELRKWFEDIQNSLFASVSSQADSIPKFYLEETEQTYILRAELPNWDLTEISYTINGQDLMIYGSHREIYREEAEDSIRHEQRVNSFEREIWFPCEIIASQAQASLKEGHFSLVLPKASR